MGDLVVKHNAFVEANYDLDLVANRVLLLAVINARKISDDVQIALEQEIVITAKQYMDCFGVNKPTAYEALKNGLEMLYQAEFTYNELIVDGEFKGDIAIRSYRFLKGKTETKHKNFIALHFSDIVAPLVIGLQNKFTAYEIEQVSKLKSKYALRLYELVISKKGLGKKLTISLLDLRKRLGILPSEFSEMRDFKKRVLKKSIDEINKYTDIELSYEQEKEGKNIVGFDFSFEFKEGCEIIDVEYDEITNSNGEQPLVIPYNADDECFADCVVKLLKKEKKAYKEQYSDEQIKAIIARANEYADELYEKGKKVAYGAIYRRAFEEDWGKEYLFKKQREAQKQRAEQEKLDKKIQKQQSENEKKLQEKERAEQRQNQLIEIFENLSTNEQEQVLNEVEKFFQGSMMFHWFDEARKQGIAYKDIRFIAKFYEFFGI